MSEKIPVSHDRIKNNSVLRSQSFNIGSDFVEEDNYNDNRHHHSVLSHEPSATSDVNSNPEGFVVLNGQAIRVQRKTLKFGGNPLSNSFDSLESSVTANIGIAHVRTHDTEEPSVAYLKQALENSNAIVARQNKELNETKSRVEELELFIASLNLPPSLALDALHIKGLTTSGLNVNLAEKSSPDVEVNYITPKNQSSSTVPPTKRRFFPSPEEGSDEVLVSTNSEIVDDTTESSKKKIPTQLISRLSLGSTERRKLGSNNNVTAAASPSLSKQAIMNRHIDPNASPLDNISLTNVESPTMSECGSATSCKTPSAANGSQRRLVKGRKTFRSESPAHEPSVVLEDYTTPKPKFNWKQRIESAKQCGNKSPHCIFIAHDNPQISKTIESQLPATLGCVTPKASAVNGMQIMLESKGPNDLTHFLIGDIIYSGDYAHVQDANLEGCRGSECLIATNLKAVRHPIKQFQTRNSPTNKDIVEINMVDLPASSIVDVSSTEGVSEFLSCCKARVDCILDPYQTYNTWYPYYEGNGRKMAPQFRSQGIGYIRLGDDMSNYGIAFISLDAGMTYLDNGATNIVEAKTDKLFATFGGSSNNLTAENKVLLSSTDNLAGALKSIANNNVDSEKPQESVSRKNSVRNMRSLVREASVENDIVTATTVNSVKVSPKSCSAILPKGDVIQELLTSLKDTSVKWSQRTQILNTLCSQLENISRVYQSVGAIGIESFLIKHNAVMIDVLSVLLDHIQKQKNPLTVVATLNCVCCFTFGELLVAHFSVYWRALLVESIHLLRSNNKQVYETAVAIANSLYSTKSITFASLSGGLLSDILAGPKSSNSTVVANTAAGGANITKIVTWLDGIARMDLHECLENHIGLESGSLTQNDAFKGVTAFKSNIGAIFRKLNPLLTHREESTRESIITLLSTYCVLLVFYSLSQVSTFFHAVQSESVNSIEERTQLLYKSLLDEAVVEVLKGIEKSVPRSFEKIIQTIWSQVSECSTTMRELRAKPKTVVVVTPVPVTPPKAQLNREDSDVSVREMQGALGLLRANSMKGLSRSNSRKIRRSQDEPSSTLHSSPSSASDITDSEFTPRIGLSPEDTKSIHGSGGKISPRANLQSALRNDDQYNTNITAIKNSLNDSWYEVKLLLKNVPSNESQWNELCSVIKDSKDLFPSINQLAKSLSTPAGVILRAILPFDENTSSNNQAATAKNTESFGLPTHLLKDSNVITELNRMRSLAIDFRRLIRVKIADEADMKQAMVASQMLHKFVNNLEVVSQHTSQNVSGVIASLD